MKKHRICLFLAFCLTAIAATGATWFFLYTPSRFTAEQCAQVQDGMTEEQVAAILGSSPDDSVDGKYFIGGLGGSMHSPPDWSDCLVKTWHRRNMSISVAFGRDGKSAGIMRFYYYDIESPSFWARMKFLLGIG